MTLQTEQQTALTTVQNLIDRTLQFLGLPARPTDLPARPVEPSRTHANAGLHPDLIAYDWGHMDRR